ncbi:fructose-1,6-bisphosphatase II [Halanaerobium sp. DL-01]|uniref:class II fructose-bisphosphatase n=1 Tax=Halanaerobium sp. DL-01 TaxID=1653064 RepID=UPI000DF29AC3|nr:class II fructose-bisphosphatase [Halanaerobium sp. DL-01]RCW82569.1 fructose-1,6-bisphosphatase II [Halanaerobium sp. DL-01]
MQRELTLEFVRVTEAAALAAAPWMGKGQEKMADKAAVDAMRAVFDTISISGTVVIGEGEKDEAPRLYIGEKIGAKNSFNEVDIAVDPLEGTTLVARGLPNALAVVAVAEKGSFLKAPDTYMEKIAVGPEAKGKINLDAPVEDNLRAVADSLNKSVKDLTVIILDRPRHDELISEIRKVGSRIKLISDGDVAAGIATARKGSGVDVMIGIGGATEGVLTAAALKCLGGEIQARLKCRNKDDEEKAAKFGIKDLDRLYCTDDLAKGDDIMLAITGVTDGELLKGVRYSWNNAETHSLVTRSKTGTVRFIRTEHIITNKPPYFPKNIFNLDYARE